MAVVQEVVEQFLTTLNDAMPHAMNGVELWFKANEIIPFLLFTVNKISLTLRNFRSNKAQILQHKTLEKYEFDNSHHRSSWTVSLICAYSQKITSTTTYTDKQRLETVCLCVMPSNPNIFGYCHCIFTSYYITTYQSNGVFFILLRRRMWPTSAVIYFRMLCDYIVFVAVCTQPFDKRAPNKKSNLFEFSDGRAAQRLSWDMAGYDCFDARQPHR